MRAKGAVGQELQDEERDQQHCRHTQLALIAAHQADRAEYRDNN